MKYSFEFLQTGGVPLTNDLMALIEEAYGIFETLADVAGNLTILSGAEITGSTVNPGIVAIEGKLYYFEGGTATSKVYINTEEIQETFQDQTTKTLIKKRTVKFGLSTVTYNWADFVRLDSLKVMMEKINNSVTQQQFAIHEARLQVLEMKTAPIQNNGVVMIWPRTAPIPAFWKECTDLRGRTPIGYDPNYAYNSAIHAINYQLNQVGANVGALSEALTTAQLAKHSHFVFVNNDNGGDKPAVSHSTGGNFGYGIVGGNGNSWVFSSKQEGDDQVHNNVQPSTVVIFIEPNFP